ncbi:hypothetical protein HKT18_07970 [Flavobacterium sp. IMCC34852]|uniref:Uncharacterized protein n=1 Tax=Flavobacterium rivulicola TaxID=2732161 RepID=A0A7Y3R984_9FLAO|nr:hypothetical protein [Flavobacterium sp. IMCC34852]NNT72146.1 hypothetical protein [Flavobacterium sp. IMCC34852]
MNKTKLYNVEFINEFEGGIIEKIALTSEAEWIFSFINTYKDICDVEILIEDIDNALNGRNIKNTDISTNDEIVFLSKDGIEFWDEEGKKMIAVYPLMDFKERLLIWRNFLKTPPFHEKKINKLELIWLTIKSKFC